MSIVLLKIAFWALIIIAWAFLIAGAVLYSQEKAKAGSICWIVCVLAFLIATILICSIPEACPNCGRPVVSSDYCSSCGAPLSAPLELVCPNCGNEICDEWQFCGNCGIRLDSIFRKRPFHRPYYSSESHTVSLPRC